jgi:hypothetical protein
MISTTATIKPKALREKREKPRVDHSRAAPDRTGDLKREGQLDPLARWKEDFRRVVWNATNPLEKDEYISEKDFHDNVKIKLKVTPELTDQLGVIEIKEPWANGKPHLRAINKKAWAPHWQAARREAIAAAIARKGRPKGKDGKAKKPEERSPAEQKAHDKKMAAQFATRLASWRTDFLRYLCARQLSGDNSFTTEQNAALLPEKLLLYFATSWAAQHAEHPSHRAEDLGDIVEELGGKQSTCSGNFCRTVDVYKTLDSLPADKLRALVVRLLRAWLWDSKANVPSAAVPAADVERLAKDLNVILFAAWRQDMAGPLSQDYFELHNKEQLVALGKELDVYLEPSKPKSVMVSLLMSKKPTRLPKEIAEVVATKFKKRGK